MELAPPVPLQLEPDPAERWHALDAVRAVALLLGIWLHASLAFLPGGYFIIENNTHSAALRAIFYVIHIFRMSLFFLIAGFFARMMLQRRGMAGFIRDRSLRIGVTGLLAWAMCMVLIHFAFSWALARHYGPNVSLRMLGWPWLWLTHLWFLYYLLWLYALVLVVRALWLRLDGQGLARAALDRAVSFLVRSHLAPLAAAVPMTITLYSIHDWYAWGGIPTPDRWLAPQPAALFGYAVPFAFGWLLHRQAALLQVWRRHWWQYLLAAMVFIALSHHLVDARDAALPMRLFKAGDAALEMLHFKALYATCYSLATWTTILALLGVGLRFFANPNPRWRYLADASYWLYVAHVPLVFALQTALMDAQLHWSLKFGVIMVVTCSMLLLIYHYGVRSTALGLLMNGRKHPRTPLAALWRQPPSSLPAPAERAEA